MKIGINASFLRKPDSGIGQVTGNFLRQLQEFCRDPKHQVSDGNTYILYLEEDINWPLPDNFIKRVLLPPYQRDDLIRKVWWEKFLLPKETEKDSCDIFFSLYQSASVFKIPHLMLVHDTVWKIFPQYLGNFRKKIYYHLVDLAIPRSDAILTISRNSESDIKKYFSLGENKIQVVPIDCDPIFKRTVDLSRVDEVRKKYHLVNDYIFYIGGFDLRKNVGRLIQAYAMAARENLNLPDLVLAGAFHPQLVPLVTDLPKVIDEAVGGDVKIKEKIKQIGFVPQNEVPAIYHGAKLFCYPTLYEGFGLPVLEAFSCQCPVVTSDRSSVPEIASSDEAKLVNPKDVTAIAAAIQFVLANQGKTREMVCLAKEKSNQFSWKKFTLETLKMMESLKNIRD